MGTNVDLYTKNIVDVYQEETPRESKQGNKGDGSDTPNFGENAALKPPIDAARVFAKLAQESDGTLSDFTNYETDAISAQVLKVSKDTSESVLQN